MEGQSSTDGIVTLDVLKHSPFSPTCYGSVAYEAGSAVRSPGFYNVNSSTETQPTSNNSRKIIFANNMDNTNYVVVGSVGGTGSGLSNDGAVAIQEKNVGYFVLQTAEPEASGRYLDCVVFGSTLLS